MARNVLAVAGGVAVLALVAGAAAGLMLVKDRVRIVIQDDTVGVGPSPQALLRDEVATLRSEVAGLQQAIIENFGKLGAGLEERAALRQDEVVALARSLTESQAEQHRQVADNGKRLQAIADAVARLQGAVAVMQVAAVATPVEPRVEPSVEPPVETRVEEPPAVAATRTSTVTKSTGFLSFSLPSNCFRFDEPQDYVLVPDLCRVGFDAKSTLHDFTGVTTAVSGEFHADLDDPSGAWRGSVVCRAATLVTGLEGRDENMWEHLDTAHHAQIEMTVSRFVPARVDVAAQQVDGVVHGTMRIRGVDKEVQMPVTIHVDESKRLVVEGQMSLLLSDYKVPVPSQLGGAITMQDQVKVWVALRARPKLGGGK